MSQTVTDAQTHKFEYGSASSYARCVCGAEQDILFRDGKSTRVYRQSASGAWEPTIGRCAEYVEPAPPPPKAEPKTSRQPSGPISGAYGGIGEGEPWLFEPELIDGCNVHDVADEAMLDVAFTPVIYRRNTFTATDVTQLEGGRYRVYLTREDALIERRVDGAVDVDAASLKVMRARYLLTHYAFIRSANSMAPEARWNVERQLYPRGNVPWIPPPGSPLAEMKGPISIRRDVVMKGAEIDMAALFEILATPGAAIPAVAPTLLPKGGDEPEPGGYLINAFKAPSHEG